MFSHETWLLFGPHLQRTASPATPVLVHISAVRGASLPFQITDAVIIHYPGRMERHFNRPTLGRPRRANPWDLFKNISQFVQENCVTRMLAFAQTHVDALRAKR